MDYTRQFSQLFVIQNILDILHHVTNQRIITKLIALMQFSSFTINYHGTLTMPHLSRDSPADSLAQRRTPGGRVSLPEFCFAQI